MFKQITIVQLTDMNPLFDIRLSWPEVSLKKTACYSNMALLASAGLLAEAEGLADVILTKSHEPKANMIVLPVYYQRRGHNNVVEVLGDLSSSHYEEISQLLVDFDYNISQSGQFWSLKSDWRHVFSEDVVSIASQLPHVAAQEIEMALYSHPANIAREARQQRPVSGLWFLNRSPGKVFKMSVVSNVKMLPLLTDVSSVEAWLENPVPGVMIVLGSEAGDCQLERVKEEVLALLETGRCAQVRLVQPGVDYYYSAHLFASLCARLKVVFS
ncbi:hypothetical protein [Candidatus Synchoanobacter obligatus]|uniref:Uncharacterized protein n=1 Tax=Candidatus Synchoanobacter obligatus TaxID=2919597 RepID=A0ABT1L5Z1_9GAMM|nr:hypothetical protein [Candidatus Synchoanobacter obligatus]MCP8352562.1 hypothetical protein [Candidatus Synchoanobacter obligatus]